MNSSPLSQSKVAAFKQRGYCVTDVLFEASLVGAVREEIERAWDATRGEGDSNPFGRIRPQLQHLHATSTLLGEFCRHPTFAAIAETLLGLEADLVFNQAFIKAGGAHPRAEVPWHQDAAFAELTELGYNCFVAITPMTAENGALRVAAARPLVPHDWDDTLAFPRCRLEADAGELIEMTPGQVLIFDQQVFHRSEPNRTTEPRIAYSLGYSSPKARLKRGHAVFGERVPLVRGGRHVDTLLWDHAETGAGGEDGDLVRAVLSELEERGIPAATAFSDFRQALPRRDQARDLLRQLVTPDIAWGANADQGNIVDKSSRQR